jgi:Kdo2-lipid IVA lauroyltransferase/acyltransferase
MGAVAFYIVSALIRVITLLPLEVMYIFSYPLFFILYLFPGYRRDITRTNLRNSFPEKSIKEIRRIERKFYMHLADIFVETLKVGHMSQKEIKRRYHIVNPELPASIMASGKDILAVAAHYNNWEWFIATPLYLKHKILVIYKPLKDKRFDKMIHQMRSRFGIILTPMSHIVKEIITYRNRGERTMSIFVADQTPPKGDIKYWTNFLNQDTPVYLGSEKVATKYNMAVLYLNVRKTSRGHYELEFEELYRETGGLPEYAVTEAHVRKLETIIRERPEYWIWTHRRWKYKREIPDA